MTKSKLLITSVFAIAIILAILGVHVYSNYKLVNGKLVNTNALEYTNLENAYMDAYERGDTDVQIEYAEKMKDLGVNSNLSNIYLAQSLVNQGSIYFKKHENIDKAIIILTGVLMKSPSNAKALSTLAYAYELKGDLLKALEYYNLALRIDSENDYALARRGYVYDLVGEFGKAEDDYVKALSINPENNAALLYMAKLYHRTGEPDLTIEYADKVLDLSEDSYLKAIASDLIGQVAIDTSEYNLAIEYFNFAIENNPNFAGAYEHRAYARLLVSSGTKGSDFKTRMEQVAGDLQKATDINPKSSFLLMLRGLEQDVLGQKDTAKATYIEALDAIQDDVTLGVVEKENLIIEIEALIAQIK